MAEETKNTATFPTCGLGIPQPALILTKRDDCSLPYKVLIGSDRAAVYGGVISSVASKPGVTLNDSILAINIES